MNLKIDQGRFLAYPKIVFGVNRPEERVLKSGVEHSKDGLATSKDLIHYVSNPRNVHRGIAV